MASRYGMNNNNIKQENRGLILKLIATGACASRIELAKRTGLSKMSVSNIVGEFLERGVVEEREAEPVEGQGRNPILLQIGAQAPVVVGLNIHRSECVAILSDLNLRVIKMARSSLCQENSGRLGEIICGLLDEVMAAGGGRELLGIGVGALGPVDIRQGSILNPPNFYGIHDFSVLSFLRERYELPICLDSQFNCAALAEKYYGVGRPYHDFIFVGIMDGIGSGLLLDEKIFRNSNGFTSELGHVSIDWHGNACSCGGRGCLETYADSRVIERRLQKATGRMQSFPVFCRETEQPGWKESAVEAIFEDMTEKLACGLTSTVNLINPQAIIIGHEGFFMPDRYLSMLEEKINSRKLSGGYRHVRVLKSAFGSEAHILGCACAVLNRIFEGKQRESAKRQEAH